MYLDLAPDKTIGRVVAEVTHPRGARSLSSHLQSRAGIRGVRMGLLRELLPAQDFDDPYRLASAIKSLPLDTGRPASASTRRSAVRAACGSRHLNDELMLRKLPGVFCAGEMLDWEAPTGGYLLTACFASGRAAGQGAGLAELNALAILDHA